MKSIMETTALMTTKGNISIEKHRRIVSELTVHYENEIGKLHSYYRMQLQHQHQHQQQFM